jgi:hypothetical protein
MAIAAMTIRFRITRILSGQFSHPILHSFVGGWWLHHFALNRQLPLYTALTHNFSTTDMLMGCAQTDAAEQLKSNK